MVELVQSQKVLDDLEQAVHFTHRARSKSHRDLLRGLFVTHNFSVSNANIDHNALLPGGNIKPTTFTTSIGVTGVAATGIICEFGDNVSGFKVAIDSNIMYVAAGDNAGAGGIDGNVALGQLAEVGASAELCIAVNPGNGKVRLWVNGTRRLTLNAGQQFGNSGVWASTNNGSVGAAQAGASSTTRGQAIIAAPTDFVLIEAFRMFNGQLPKNFG